ncbi:MAG: hypothetical protein ACI9AX_002888, partial [Polaromonas sp.]
KIRQILRFWTGSLTALHRYQRQSYRAQIRYCHRPAATHL